MIGILLLAFALNALAPAGYMIAAGEHGLPTVSVCPETHPLARAVTAYHEARDRSDGMAKDHASMDHASIDHASIDHAAMGHGDEGDPHADRVERRALYAGGRCQAGAPLSRRRPFSRTRSPTQSYSASGRSALCRFLRVRICDRPCAARLRRSDTTHPIRSRAPRSGPDCPRAPRIGELP